MALMLTEVMVFMFSGNVFYVNSGNGVHVVALYNKGSLINH